MLIWGFRVAGESLPTVDGLSVGAFFQSDANIGRRPEMGVRDSCQHNFQSSRQVGSVFTHPALINSHSLWHARCFGG